MLRKFWTIEVEKKRYYVELLYGLVTGKRIIKVDDKIVENSRKIIDTGSFHIFFIEKHRCIVAICPQTIGAEYHLFIDNRCVDTDEIVPIPSDLSDLDTMRTHSGLETHRHEDDRGVRLRIQAEVNVSSAGNLMLMYFFKRGFLVEVFTKINRFQKIWIGDVATELWTFCTNNDSRFRRYVASYRSIFVISFIGFSMIYHNGNGTSLKLTLRTRPGRSVGRRSVLPGDCLTSLDVFTDDKIFADKLIGKINTAFNTRLVKLETSTD